MIIVIYLILFLSAPLSLFFSVVGLYGDSSNWRRYLPGLIYFVFVGAYVYMPLETSNNDLPRYLEMIRLCGDMTLPQVINYFDDGLITEHLFFWIFGHIGLVHLVPAISTAIVYAVSCYITCDTAERFEHPGCAKYVLLLQFMMLPYASLINNVRNVCAFSLVILAAYLDLVKHKRNLLVILLYLLGGFLHLSAFTMVAMRIFCGLAKKTVELLLLIPFVISSAIMMIYNNRTLFRIAGIFGGGIQKLINKMYFYLTDTNSNYAKLVNNSGSFKMNKIVMMAGVALTFILIYYEIRGDKKLSSIDDIDIKINKLIQNTFNEKVRITQIRPKNNLNILAFIGLISIMTISCNVFEMPNYWRYAAAVYVCIGVVIIPLLIEFDKLSLIIKMVVLSSFLVGPLGLFIQIRLANFSVDSISWVKDILTNNILTIVLELINRIVQEGNS